MNSTGNTSRDPEFDVVLWGATGFAGELTAEYFAQRYPDTDELRWAIGGRNREKLESLRVSLGLPDLPIVVGDSHDRKSLDEMASRARVVCTTVGPYAKYGTELVAACVAQGTDYCDLTGEPQWIRRMIDGYHRAAVENHARIVHCCGFDSIPSDLGTRMVQDYAVERHGGTCEEVSFYVRSIRGGISGGTLDSMMTLMEEAGKDREVRRVLKDPYSLAPENERAGPDDSEQMRPEYDTSIGGWTGPFVMAAINERIVRRSNALLDYAYGRDFRYGESTYFGTGLRAMLAATAVTAGVGTFTAAAAVSPIRSLLRRVLPSPGEGPDREAVEAGGFTIELIGSGRDEDGREFVVKGRVTADRDPGYGATAVMLAESAACLARDENLPGLDGGVLTPASAMGMPLVHRLREAGMTFDVE